MNVSESIDGFVLIRLTPPLVKLLILAVLLSATGVLLLALLTDTVGC
jgi:hypothetical protein